MSGMSASFRGRGRSGRGTLKKYIGDSMTLSCKVGSFLLYVQQDNEIPIMN